MLFMTFPMFCLQNYVEHMTNFISRTQEGFVRHRDVDVCAKDSIVLLQWVQYYGEQSKSPGHLIR